MVYLLLNSSSIFHPNCKKRSPVPLMLADRLHPNQNSHRISSTFSHTFSRILPSKPMITANACFCFFHFLPFHGSGCCWNPNCHQKITMYVRYAAYSLIWWYQGFRNLRLLHFCLRYKIYCSKPLNYVSFWLRLEYLSMPYTWQFPRVGSQNYESPSLYATFF